MVLVSRESVYESRSSVTVAPATTRIRWIRVEVPLGTEDGMPRGSVVNVDDLVTISQDSLEEFITHLGRCRQIGRHSGESRDPDKFETEYHTVGADSGFPPPRE